jgi:hypothetical protein
VTTDWNDNPIASMYPLKSDAEGAHHTRVQTGGRSSLAEAEGPTSTLVSTIVVDVDVDGGLISSTITPLDSDADDAPDAQTRTAWHRIEMASRS